MPRYAEFFKRTAGPDSRPDPPDGAKAQKYTLLFVDDEENVLKALKRIFLFENYEILTASGGEAALRAMEQARVHLIVSDHRMPGMTGSELLKRVKERWPETIRIMLTGHADIQAIMGAVNEGAVYKFITKPWSDEDMRITVSIALQQYSLAQENRKLKEIAREQQVKIRNYSALFDEYRGIMGGILIKAGVIRKEQLETATGEKKDGEFIGDAIVRLGFATEQKIMTAVQRHQNVERIDFRETRVYPSAARFLPRELCEKSRLIPVKLEDGTLIIAMADPSDILKLDNISMLTGLKVKAVIAGSSEILSQLRQVHGEGDATEEVKEIDELEFEPMEEIDIVIDEDDSLVNVQELIDSSEVPPVVRIVNAIITEALRYRASDIHIEPKTKYSVVRYRIDGMLYAKIRIPVNLHSAVVSRLKVLAKIDISERRKPQDGRITIKASTRIVDVRLSTMPTLNGEKVVMRILDKGASIKKLDELGMLEEDLKRLNMIIRKPQGMLISTGPTGSGKTTMLYSMLHEMLQTTKNFETIEDPVEYFLEEVNQVHVREQIGLTFPSVLRATLRQDPDIILVGEIRDFDTADVAFKAALTGHMVLTSLHTNNTVASITRLIDLGVKPYLIASALEGIMAQRLVRKVCQYCRTEVEPNAGMLAILRVPEGELGKKLYAGRGCPRCNHTGYLGRTGIFEFLAVDDDIRQLISGNYRESEVWSLARKRGVKTLMEDGLEKVKAGITTLEELLRVMGPTGKSERTCEQCGKSMDSNFLFCPWCGSFKQDVCRKCSFPLEESWSVCPACGTSRTKGPE